MTKQEGQQLNFYTTFQDIAEPIWPDYLQVPSLPNPPKKPHVSTPKYVFVYLVLHFWYWSRVKYFAAQYST